MILEGKVALVTGSTSGIGLAIARAFAAEGASVMLNGFGDPAEIERLCEELGAIHDGADLSDPGAHPPPPCGACTDTFLTRGHRPQSHFGHYTRKPMHPANPCAPD